MKNREYSKVVFTSTADTRFMVSIEPDGTLIITTRSLNFSPQRLSVDPYIPLGYRYVTGEPKDGLVIERKSDGSQLTFVPLCVIADGTIDGYAFQYEFGRRRFYSEVFREDSFNEPLEDDFVRQILSVNHHGGFYISKYDLSMSPKGNPQSMPGTRPYTCRNFIEAYDFASKFEESSENISSHLTYGSEHDTMLAWVLNSGVRKAEIEDESNCHKGREQIKETGSCKKWDKNNISDLNGNVDEWTQEYTGKMAGTVRGSGIDHYGWSNNPFHRYFTGKLEDDSFASLRAVLWLK